MSRPDWLILSLHDNGPGHYYRYSVELVNTSDDSARIHWSVPSVVNPRYAVHPDAEPGTAEALERARKPEDS